MDDPDITMEEYIQLMADKARRRGQTFNWETATFGREYGDDFDLFINFETYIPAIVYNDASTSYHNVSSEPTVSIYNAIKSNIDFSISYFDFEDEDYTFTYDKDSLFPKLIHVDDLKSKPVNDHVEINTELCSENIDIKPMDSIVCISNNTTPIEFDENVETNHDTTSLNTTYSERWIRRIELVVTKINFWWSTYNLEVVDFVGVLKKFETAIQHIFARKRKRKIIPSKSQGSFSF
ncbi:hypothetical protein Tco_0158653 [Tanacetum coccineum]